MMRTLIDSQIESLDLVVKEGETLNLRLASFAFSPDASIHVRVEKEGVFDGVFADFSQGNTHLKVQVELVGEGAKASWYYAGVSESSSNKILDVSMEHLAPKTEGDVTQYGIAMAGSRLTFIGTSHIHAGMKKSATAQKEKIIVFDKEAVGKCSPILRIDENDVAASHSAVVGKLSDEHLFYMLSRGVDIVTAKRLLTLGYLRPVLAYYEEDVAAKIQAQIEGGF